MSEKTPRLVAPDLARGGMLLLIALANAPIFTVANMTVAPHDDQDTFSRAMAALTLLFADGRAYPLFSMLFGFGFAMLAASRRRAGADDSQVRRYLLVRMLWLLAIGAVHGLFFPGDILGAYALTGLVLVPLVLARPRTVWIVTAIFGSVWVLYSVSQMVLLGTTGANVANGGLPALEGLGYNLLLNIAFWLVGSVATVLFATLPLALLGLMMGRTGWLSLTPERRPVMVRTAAIALTVGVVSALPGVAAVLGLIGGLGWWGGLALLFGPAMALGYLALAALVGDRLQSRAARSPLARALVATGQRSMTSYLLQTVLFILVLAPYGPIALAESASSGVERLVAPGVWAVTVVVAVLLARAGKPGPADALLRRLSNRPLASTTR